VGVLRAVGLDESGGAELGRRDLLAEANRVRKVLLREHHARKNAARAPGGK